MTKRDREWFAHHAKLVMRAHETGTDRYVMADGIVRLLADLEESEAVAAHLSTAHPGCRQSCDWYARARAIRNGGG